jgi:hypothetical protein
MDILCPHCNHLVHLKVTLNVKAETEQEVKEDRTWSYIDNMTRGSLNHVGPYRKHPVDKDRAVEASVVKPPLVVTREQKGDIRTLFNSGHSVYQIKNRLKLDLEPEQIRRIGLGRE